MQKQALIPLADGRLVSNPFFCLVTTLVNTPCRADIAQLVEQRIRNAKVVGSTLLSATISTSPDVRIHP